MKIVLISTYELGRQPFGIASPMAWLKQVGASVTCLDLSIQPLVKKTIADANIIAFYVPMHTATRIAIQLLEKIKTINAEAHICFYGLYASVNESLFRKLGAGTILGGEFETGLVSMVKRLSSDHPKKKVQSEPLVSLTKQKFLIPDRGDLPQLADYAHLDRGDDRKHIVGYTEASRGCKHKCLHCPIVPVYEGKFRVVQKDIVINDIKHQLQTGATHITFGDPDFFNGVGHTLPIVQQLHQEYPDLTYDVTIKVEHLLRYSQHLPLLKETGCLFVTTAVESFDNTILDILDKGHTTEDFKQVVSLCHEMDLALNPTFVAFTPWIRIESYFQMLNTIFELNLVEQVTPIQYTLRLLIPAKSKLLTHPSIKGWIGSFDEEKLIYPWAHSNPKVDELQKEVFAIVKTNPAQRESRFSIFEKIWNLAHQYLESVPPSLPPIAPERSSKTIPQMSEFWYC